MGRNTLRRNIARINLRDYKCLGCFCASRDINASKQGVSRDILLILG